MFKQMLLGLGAASLLVVVTAMPVQAGHIPLPSGLQELIVLGTKVGTGSKWEWVWVSACPDGEAEGCSLINEGPHYGFGPPTIDQWTESFGGFSELLNAFRNPAYNASLIASDENSPTLCAARYFSNEFTDYTDCNSGDVGMGIVWQSPGPLFGSVLTESPNADVFYARATEPPSSPLPEPSSLLLLGAGLLGLAAWRWKHTA